MTIPDADMCMVGVCIWWDGSYPVCHAEHVESSEMWNWVQVCCGPSLVIRSSACASLQMCSCPIPPIFFFFFSSVMFLLHFSEELNIKSIISSDLNMQFNFLIFAVLVGTQSKGAWEYWEIWVFFFTTGFTKRQL